MIHSTVGNIYTTEQAHEGNIERNLQGNISARCKIKEMHEIHIIAKLHYDHAQL